MRTCGGDDDHNRDGNFDKHGFRAVKIKRENLIMGNEIVKHETATMTTDDLRRNINLIQGVLRDVMQNDVHYGVVPGCGNKPALLKPGAEKILATFRIGVNYEVEDLGNENERRCRVTAKGFYIPTGNPIGCGIGECSSNEKKFAWREAICQEEFDSADANKKQILFRRGYKSGQFEKVMQIKTVPADIANTVLKMGKKRAMIDLCLSAVACSDIFTQDIIEEGAEIDADNASATAEKAEQKSDSKPAGNPISEAQANRLFAILSNSKRTQEDLKNYLSATYGIDSTRDIDKSSYPHICDWVEGKL